MNRTPPLAMRLVLIVLLVAAGAVTVRAMNAWRSMDEDRVRIESLSARLGSSSPDDAEAGSGDESKTGKSKPDPKKPKEPTPPSSVDLAMKRIEEKFIFSSKPPQRFRSVIGVLGDSVIFQGDTVVPVGGTFDSAKVIAIGSDWVELEHDGERITIGVFGGRGSREPDPPKQPAAADKSGDAKPADAKPGDAKAGLADAKPGAPDDGKSPSAEADAAGQPAAENVDRLSTTVENVDPQRLLRLGGG